MIRLWFRMKKQEILVKTMFYSTIINFTTEQEDILGFVQKLYLALKNVSDDEFNAQFVKNIAEIIHKDNQEKE